MLDQNRSSVLFHFAIQIGSKLLEYELDNFANVYCVDGIS